MSIDLDQETQRLIELEIQAGGFRDASAFVGAAVRHFLITREDLGSTREQIDAMIASAAASLAHGVSPAEVRSAIASRDLSKKGPEHRQFNYIERTIRKAASALGK